MEIITPSSEKSLMEIAKNHGAIYVCPKVDGKRVGPLVVYAGKDSRGRNFVGDIYFNFRRIECYPQTVKMFAEAAYKKLYDNDLLNSFDTICGIPEGGRTFGQMLALIAGKKFAYAGKKPKPTEPGKKQEYTWDISHFKFKKGERVAMVEDVFNNFQNTDATMSEISTAGVEIVLLIGALNRSSIHSKTYKGLPIIASICQAFPEYEQDDPVVAMDIAAGNVEFEVKRNWDRLCAPINK